MSLEEHSSKVCVSSVRRTQSVTGTVFCTIACPIDGFTLRIMSSVAPGQACRKEAAVCRQIKGHSVRWNCAPHTDIKFRVIPSKRTLVYAVTAQPSAFHVFVKRWLRRLLGQQDTACCLKVILCSRLLSCRQWLKIVRNFRELAP